MAGTPSLRKLEYVLTVARERHFGKAAERLHIDPSSLSRQVREVEEELEFEIFVRANHYVALTNEGAMFVQDLDQMLSSFLAQFENAKNLARLRSRRKASSFVIGYSPFVAPTIPRKIRAVQSERFPFVHLESRRQSVQELTDSLIADACQACVMVRPVGQHNLEELPVRREHLFAVWSLANHANHSEEVQLSELRAHPLILPCSDRTDPVLHRWLWDQCAAAGFKLKVVAEASSPSEAFNLVQDGFGIAIVPGGVCGNAPGDFRCSPIGGLETLFLVIAYRRGASRRVQKLVADIACELDRADLAIAS
jgi:DNA-binding transcriptional LysR family regulator